jgi:diaminohydroxyphosphoribosylaminopyrimidine deaminase / 5-amino-6-(5-phosphoribosylamino)uracil reductase
MNNDVFYMKKCIELAKKGWGKTNPNPLVGCVIVKNDLLISQGCHKGLGLAHAEVEAFLNAKEDVSGATLYVNLEPCSHFGRTPPCVDSIISRKISRVVVGMLDPNPKVQGRGIQKLMDAGIDVTVGVLENEAKKLNEIFIKYITLKLPYVILKTAMTLDGKIASHTGNSKWITSEKSRLYVHKVRNRVSAIMVGINTLLLDDPSLDVRLKNGQNPKKIIVDSFGNIPLDAKVFSGAPSNVILATTELIDSQKESLLKEKGVTLIKTRSLDGRVNLLEALVNLAQLEIDSVLLEGGGALNASFLEQKLVDKILFFIAPKILGGKTAVTPVEGIGIPNVADALLVKDIKTKTFGSDLLIEGYL